MWSYKLSLFLLLISCSALLAQETTTDQPRFSLVDVNKGLSNNRIHCFLKDKSGYLWIGTEDGLNRYDGSQVRIYQHDSRDTTSIIANTINKLFEDPAGNIWVLTPAGMAVYDPQQDKFFQHTTPFLEPYGLAASTIDNIIQDKVGNYWFLLRDEGLLRYNPYSKQGIYLQARPELESAISTNKLTALAQNSHGDYWILHTNGVLEQLDGQTLAVKSRRNDLHQYFKGQLHEYALFIDSDDDLWLYQPFGNSGAFLYKPSNGSFTAFTKERGSPKLNTNMVNGIVEEKKGIIWLGTDHGGLNIINKNKGTIQYVLAEHEGDNQLAHNSINGLYKDSEGIIWIGTFKKGVNLYHENIIRFRHHKNQVSDPESLPFDDVNRFVEDKKGNLWIGTNGGGLLYLDRTTGHYTRYLHNPADPHSLSSNVIVSMLLDNDNILWLGTYTGGLNRFDGKRFTHFRHDPNNPNSLPCHADNVWELMEDTKGNLWVGTMRGGLARFDKDQEAFHRIPTGSARGALISAYISALAEDKQGNIWVGGTDGIEVFDPESGDVTRYMNNAANAHGPGINQVLAIHVDTFGQVWVGTQEGLQLFNQQTQSFTRYTKEQGLPHNTVITILEDESQSLWLGTPNGLSSAQIDRNEQQLNHESVSFRNFNIGDGLQDNVFNENAAFKTSNGELIFGGPNGFNLFYPDKVKGGQQSARLVFTDFSLFNRRVEVGQEINGRVLLPAVLQDQQQITLKHSENVFTVGFTSLAFLHPETIRYRYRLQGFDEQWQQSDDKIKRITYTNLDPGDYTLRIQATDQEGHWHNKEIKLNIAVLAPFWRTNTAYVLYMLMVVVALYILRRVELQKANMKYRLAQARHEARQRHELDMMKIRFFTNVSHEFRTPLSLILAPLDHLIKLNQEPEQQKQFQMIQRNARRLLNLVNQLLDFRKLEVEGVSLCLSEGNIIKFIEASVQSFSDLSERKNIKLECHAAMPALEVSFDMDKLEKILFNLLSNAFKFTPEGGNITVTVNCLENDSASQGFKLLEIKVADTGIGIPKDKQVKVFERFFRDEVPGEYINQGSGIGLAITKEFVKIHGGTIAVESEVGQGSCFQVIIPVKEICPKQQPHFESTLFGLSDSEEQEPGPSASLLNADLSRPEVLLVEDNEDFRVYLKENLNAYYTIIEAPNGKVGWQLALSQMPDLIVSDLMMPLMNGIDFCKKIKQDSRTCHIPFVLLTAQTAEEQKLKGLNIGANDYITKPFNFQLLHSRLHNLIVQRQQMQQAYEKRISVQSSEQAIVSMDNKLILSAIQAVEENLDDPDYTVEKLSRELGMSRVHLYKKLLSLTGKPPLEFMKKIRLQRAAQLLEKSQLTVAEVAYKVGFNNAKYFTKCFKQEYQILPSVYAERKNQS